MTTHETGQGKSLILKFFSWIFQKYHPFLLIALSTLQPTVPAKKFSIRSKHYKTYNFFLDILVKIVLSVVFFIGVN